MPLGEKVPPFSLCTHTQRVSMCEWSFAWLYEKVCVCVGVYIQLRTVQTWMCMCVTPKLSVKLALGLGLKLGLGLGLELQHYRLKLLYWHMLSVTFLIFNKIIKP